MLHRKIAVASLLLVFGLQSLAQDYPSQLQAYIDQCKMGKYDYQPHEKLEVDTALMLNKRLVVYFNDFMIEAPMRDSIYAHLVREMQEVITPSVKKMELWVGKHAQEAQHADWQEKGYPYAPRMAVKDLIPNAYARKPMKSKRYAANTTRQRHITKISLPTPTFDQGLDGRHIALWGSHGWYYENKLDRWEWQRARTFQTVEDLYASAYVIPFLAPMLENAGAVTYMPRERDWHANMYLVDNESSGFQSTTILDAQDGGWADGLAPYTSGENPFTSGSHFVATSSKKGGEIASWNFEGMVPANYAVYIAYQQDPEAAEAVSYTVHHKDQRTQFQVNQTMGGNMWVYLGHFDFDTEAKVTVSNKGKKNGKRISIDAVRIGGGMGDVARKGKTSQRPRFFEAARYYHQFNGVPESVYNLHQDTLDYRDDYQSRAEWVNYLASVKRTKSEETNGLNLPIDLSIAVHSDAGITRNDTTKGTLMIYSSYDTENGMHFPNGVSRLSNRDLADMVQTQIVEDIRIKYDASWMRRELWDKRYSEATYASVPSLLLEILSHQNFLDMKFGLDPQFRFDVSRAVYKGTVKYLASQYDYDYVIQPLAPQQLAIALKEGAAHLNWEEQTDPLEPTAVAKGYVVYTKVDDGGWDHGQVVKGKALLVPVEPGRLYAFRVRAYNSGGISFPSETLVVADHGNDPALLVHGFTRVSAPQSIEAGSYMGFLNEVDQGVPYGYDLSFIGAQYNFDGDSPWIDDDQPGHGASHADMETTIIKGNTFDATRAHGQALHQLGYSFTSTSQQAVEQGVVDLSDYWMVDWVLGEQRTTPSVRTYQPDRYRIYTDGMKNAIESYLENEGKLMVTGASIGTDLFFEPQSHINKGDSTADVLFGEKVLHMIGRTNQADRLGHVVSYDSAFAHWQDLTYQKQLNAQQYCVESPDGIDPADELGKTIIRYSSNNISAGICWKHEQTAAVLIGFPFESIVGPSQRTKAMEDVLKFFRKD